MGLRPDICGQEEALHRFRLMQLQMNEAIKRLLKALREKRGGTIYSTIKSEHAEDWFRLLLSYLYEVAEGSDTVWHYEFGNHHGGLDNCVVRWLFHCWWREQALDLLGSVVNLTAQAPQETRLTPSESIPGSSWIAHDSPNFNVGFVETAGAAQGSTSAVPWPQTALKQHWT
ncbi:hypothetical protein LTR09_012731 [Extremus antarcticus]|uniref:Uncharacterized protein n=1 Tax=Extremus antarcticus TaxID=702011 RepID=A0AAJ0G471_9PEZI|nr:hypothetical protein LTR09_012731 [Extremus antarcticus]